MLQVSMAKLIIVPWDPFIISQMCDLGSECVSLGELASSAYRFQYLILETFTKKKHNDFFIC